MLILHLKWFEAIFWGDWVGVIYFPPKRLGAGLMFPKIIFTSSPRHSRLNWTTTWKTIAVKAEESLTCFCCFLTDCCNRWSLSWERRRCESSSCCLGWPNGFGEGQDCFPRDQTHSFAFFSPPPLPSSRQQQASSRPPWWERASLSSPFLRRSLTTWLPSRPSVGPSPCLEAPR